MEKWKIIPGTDNNYMASEGGQIKSLLSGRILRGSFQSCGYRRVKIIIAGKGRDRYIHRLVAEVFLPNPQRLPEVNHIDMDKANNSVDNLEWVSHKDNHKKFAGNIDRSAINSTKNLTSEQIEKIKSMVGSGVSFKKIAEVIGCSYQTVWFQLKGKQRRKEKTILSALNIKEFKEIEPLQWVDYARRYL